MVDEQLMSLQPGTVIGGRYEVVKCLGAGSMGLVYACRHRELSGHLVAVKVLFPEVAQDKVALARFRNEITASYGVSHPNVVRAFEFLRDGELYAYTMEYVGGGDLADRLGKPDKRLPIPEILSIISQMCLGVQAIHDSGIVHRDLKPENILLSKEGQVKIADFGIAKAGHGPKLTEHGGVVGTIDYVSPEYMLNAQVDWRSDIYAMGILSYEMIAGDSPFKGDSVYATMTKRLKTDPAPPSSLRKDCPREFDRIVSRAMNRDPELRYQSATEMYQDVIHLAESIGISQAQLIKMVAISSGVSAASNAAPQPKSRVEPSASQSGIAPIPDELPSGSGVKSGKVSLSKERKRSVPASQNLSRSAAREQAPGNRIRSLPGYDSGSAGILGNDPLLGTEHTEVIDLMPQRMEQVLGQKSVMDGWDSPRRARVPRMQRPTEGASAHSRQRPPFKNVLNTINRSIWVDIATLVVAVLVGIGVGFLVLHYFAPQLLGIGHL